MRSFKRIFSVQLIKQDRTRQSGAVLLYFTRQSNAGHSDGMAG